MKRSSMSIMNELDVLRDLSEEEKQAIAAQQKRSDKISSLMGEYLLKGWRMLDESCPKCGTILFMQKSGKRYCVACSEVDADDQDSVSEKAAKVVKLHSPLRTSVEPSSVRSTAAGDYAAIPVTFKTRGPLPVEKSSISSQSSTIVNNLREKLVWCMSCLEESKSAEEIGQWAEAIRCLAEAADAVHRCSVPLV
ncbi:hypothetical protein FBUS_00711 [Fasciolopsis buskii]|uniref:Uncharacterized protein n=1 Tax=Fasciolopsis buskii TaxID=27845 RepID=A0A8E0RIN7_9TREM|nr:hypothetical protein FBUS_00711 [Fasciolopsis buski]